MITLRVLTPEDMEQIRVWRNADLSPWRTPFLLTAEMQQEFYRDVVCNRNAPHRFWAVVEDASLLVGMVGLTNIQWPNRLAEPNLVMSPWWMDHADKAVDLLLEQAFDFLGLETVAGECYWLSSLRLFWQDTVERYQAFSAVLPRRKFWKGEFHDSLYFSLSQGAYRETLKGAGARE